MKKLILFLLLFSGFSRAQDSLNVSLLSTFYAEKCKAITVNGNYVFLGFNYGSWQNGQLKILDVSNPTSPTEVGLYLDSGFEPMAIAVNNNYAFVGSDYQDLRVFDISNISSPQLLNRYEEYSYDIQIEGNIAYLASETEGLVTLNVSNVNSITELGSFEPSGYAYSLFVQDTLAFVTFDEDLVRIVNVKNPANPYQLTSFDTPGSCKDVYAKDNYLFVADGTGGLLILDISDLHSIQTVSTYVPAQTAFSIEQVVVLNGYAYLADAGFGVRIIDLTDISSPQEVGYYRIDHGSYKLAVQGNKIYSINYYTCSVLQNNLLTGIDEKPTVVNGFQLYQNYPNPFNPSTTITYTIPGSEMLHATSQQLVQLKIYDVLGREVATLVNSKQAPGSYAVTFDANSVEGELPSGIYFYKLTSGSFSKIKKMVLLR